MQASSWTKTGPVFAAANGVYGPGHNGFAKSPDGTEDWLIYHAKVDTLPNWNRVIRLQRFGWRPDGSPDFGEPVNLCLAYDPAFAYEVAVLIAEGCRRMYTEGDDVFYYLTLYNENYVMPAMRDGVEEGIIDGLYQWSAPPPAACVIPVDRRVNH